ncbi:uncharacterized protein AB675_4938 [Cyphellophora attinorum]|uniref:Trafficking protein particle complex II-specific subunit 65 IgD3 domain-containing protein n=1 Tax=Cyphellophora attinorum TaxID=1664694 RepID=A0A0N1NX57_9EURO|nr:uncharacterized protein AB675_4938 [Phialophora attinorum]KPI34623.1 hypothetical protein AB675_4938 [Phialophora attinorum]
MDAEKAILKSTAIEVVVAQDTTSELAEVFAATSDTRSSETSGLINIKRRDLVFIDERLRVLVLLSVPPCDEDVLKAILSKANIRVEAWAQDVAASNGSTADAVRDMISSITLDLTEEPIVVAQETGHSQRTSLVLAWPASITLARPRVRMMDPAVSFYSVLTVTYPDDSSARNRLLQPFEAIEKNVFDTLRLPPGQGAQPYLPASALTKIVPEQTPAPQQSRIEHMSARMRLVPVVGSRMTYHRSDQCIIGALNIEVIPYVELEAEINNIQVSIAHGTVEDLTKDLLSIKCRSRDISTFLYRLRQAPRTDTNPATGNTTQLSNLDVLTIRLELSITVSKLCQPRVQMDYTTNIDFFQALNPTYGGPNQPMQRPHRPASLPLNNTNNQQSTGHSQGQTQPTALNTTLQPTLNLSTFTGVSISSTAPTDPVKVGIPFTWRLLVNNQSTRAAKLAIYPLPRISKSHSAQAASIASVKRHTSRLSITSGRSRDKQHTLNNPDSSEQNNIAQAVVDENILYALQHSHHSPQNQGDIIALTPELRVSGLGPGQCHEGEIEFVALKAGTFQVDAIRVVDVVREAEEGISAPGVMVDLGELPDIVAVE